MNNDTTTLNELGTAINSSTGPEQATPIKRGAELAPLFHIPFNSYLMLRCDFVLLTGGDALEAMLLRIIEQHMQEERKRLLQQGDQEVPRAVWVAISYRQFLYQLYGSVKSENTLKRALNALRSKGFLLSRYQPEHRYAPPEYQLHLERIDAEFELMARHGKAGYQALMASTPEESRSKQTEVPPSPLQNRYPARGAKVASNNKKVSSNTTKTIESTAATSSPKPPRDAALARLSSLEIMDEELSAFCTVVEKLRQLRSPQAQATPSEAAMTQEEQKIPHVQEERPGVPLCPTEAPPVSERETPLASPEQAPPRPESAATLAPEALVATVEHKRAARFSPSTRAVQLQAASVLLALPEPFSLDEFERAYDECNNPKGRALYGEILVSHLAEIEHKHGRPRFLRLLERVRGREVSVSHLSGDGGRTVPHRVTEQGFPPPKLSPEQLAHLAAIKAKLGKGETAQIEGRA